MIEFKNGSYIKTIESNNIQRGQIANLQFNINDYFELTKFQRFKLTLLDLKIKIVKRLFPYAYYTKYYKR